MIDIFNLIVKNFFELVSPVCRRASPAVWDWWGTLCVSGCARGRGISCGGEGVGGGGGWGGARGPCCPRRRRQTESGNIGFLTGSCETTRKKVQMHMRVILANNLFLWSRHSANFLKHLIMLTFISKLPGSGFKLVKCLTGRYLLNYKGESFKACLDFILISLKNICAVYINICQFQGAAPVA